MEIISIQVDADVAKAFQSAQPEQQKNTGSGQCLDETCYEFD